MECRKPSTFTIRKYKTILISFVTTSVHLEKQTKEKYRDRRRERLRLRELCLRDLERELKE